MAQTSDFLNHRLGNISSDYFKSKAKYRAILNAELDDSHSLDCRLAFEFFPVECIDLASNRLLCGFPFDSITLHDMTPVYHEPYKYPQVAQTFPFLPPPNAYLSVGNDCVRWRTYDCGLFSASGHFPALNVYDTATATKVTTFFIQDADVIYQHCYNPSQQNIIGCVALHRRTHLIDLRLGSICQTLTGNFGHMVSIAWSPNREHIFFTASNHGEIVSWDSRNGSVCLVSSNICPKSLLITPELQFDEFGKYLLCLSTDRKIRVLDQCTLNNRILVNDLDVAVHRRRFQFSVSTLTNPPLLFVPNGKCISIYNINTGELVKNFIGHIHSVIIVKYNDLNDEVYSVGDDNLFCVWKKCKELN